MGMITATDMAIAKTVNYSFDEAITKVTDRLKEQGFGILTEIDVKSTLKAKIDVDFRRYTILGACNPPFAHEALQAELNVGLMMPCNVIVYETDDGKVQVSGFNPEAMISAFDRDDLTDIATQIRSRMATAIEGL
jgi:uncharacterized protein (DUF302 family)